MLNFISITSNTSNNQELTTPLVPTDNTIVQANIMTTGDQAIVTAFPGGHTPQVLPDQTPVKMLSRLRELSSFNWATTDTGVLYFDDLEHQLRHNAEHADVLQQFALYRSDFKLFVRINTNQFYSGALMVTIWPRRADFGTYRAQRYLLDPVVMSASTQQSAEINVSYPFPQEWLVSVPDDSIDPLNQQLYYCVEVLAPLRANSDTLTDTVKVQIFGAYVNPLLQFNRDAAATAISPLAAAAKLEKTTPTISRQSKMEVTKKKGDSTYKSTISATPAKDAATRGDGTALTFDKVAPTLSSIPILGTIAGSLFDLLKIGTGTVSSLAPTLSALAPLAPLILDKPDSAVDGVRMVVGVGIDNFASDVASIAIPVTHSKDNYSRMVTGLGVRLGNWSLAEYASLPSVVGINTLDATTTTGTIPIVGTPTPLGYLQSRFVSWKSSIKVKMQFFCSAFTSVRLAIYMVPLYDTSSNYDDHIVKIVDIKGDTDVSFVVPWVSATIWQDTDVAPYKLLYRTISPIIGSDNLADPNVCVVTWIAAGADFQVALPANAHAWSPPTEFPLPEVPSAVPLAAGSLRRVARHLKRVKLPDGSEKQSAIQRHFASESFDPIVEGCSFILDNNFTISDVPVTFSDITKAYYETGNLNTMTIYSSDDWEGGTYARCFGVIRGGYRIKFKRSGAPSIGTNVHLNYRTGPPVGGTVYTGRHGVAQCNPDGYQMLSIPWVDKLPFAFKGDTSLTTMYVADTDLNTNSMSIAMRDDVLYGLPVLPLSTF